jgi:hypothetical protein
MSGSHLDHMTRLRDSWCGASSLRRGWACNLFVNLLLGLARAVTLGSNFRSTDYHILLSRFRLPQTRSARSPYSYPPWTGWPIYIPGHWVPSQGYGGGILTHFHTEFLLYKSSYITTDGQSASLSWCQASTSDPRPIFLLLYLFLESYGFIDVGHPLWREVRRSM